MEKMEFVDLCRELASSEDHALSRAVLKIVDSYRAEYHHPKMPVIWLETNDSGDNNISFMNTTYPYLGQVFANMIDLMYSNTFMAAQGREAIDMLHRAAEQYAGQFTLVVEGAIPLKDNGIYNVVFITDTKPITALEAVTWLGSRARFVVAVGTCASFGGPSAARPNLTESVGIQTVLKRPVINVSGCPVNPDWFVGTLAHLLL